MPADFFDQFAKTRMVSKSKATGHFYGGDAICKFCLVVQVRTPLIACNQSKHPGNIYAFLNVKLIVYGLGSDCNKC